MLKHLLAFLLTGVMFVNIAAQNSTVPVKNSENNMPMLDKKKFEPLRVGMSLGFPPFEFKDGKGKITGFDVDIASELAKAMGCKLEIVVKEWNDLIPSLTDDKIDIIISGMSITLDRARIVYFSKPYFETKQVIITKKDTHLSMFEKGIKVGVLKESTGEKLSKNVFPEGNIIPYTAEEIALGDLGKDKIAAMIIDKPYAEFYLNKDKNLKISFEIPESEKYAFAIRKDDIDFLFWLNYFIDYLEYTGKYQSIYKRWFSKT